MVQQSPEIVHTEDELRDLFSFTDLGKTWPFFEDENCNITGYGHQDKATFAAAVNEYDREVGGVAADDAVLDHRDVSHGYCVIDAASGSDPEYWTFTWGYPKPGQSRPEPYTADHPGAVPITTIWGVR